MRWLIFLLFITSCGHAQLRAFDADTYSCDDEMCRAIWYRGVGEPEKTIICDDASCLCFVDMVTYHCDPLDQLNSKELIRIWEEGCCQ